MSKVSNIIQTRRQFLRNSGASAGALVFGHALLSRSAVAQTQPIVLKVAHPEQTTNSLHKAFLRFKELVEQRSNGEIEIRIFPGGQLGGIRDVVEGMRMGTIEITSTGPDYTSNLVPLMITSSLYYLWRSPEHVSKVLDGPVGEQLNQALIGGANLRILTWGHQGFRSIVSKGEPILSPSDLQGVKIRVPEASLHVEPFKAMGANPTPIPYGEVYTALQTNVVDAAEGVPVAMIQMKFYEVADHFSLTQHLFNPIHILISEPVYQRLSPEQQQVLTDSAKEAFQYQRQLSAEENAKALDEIRAGGVEVHEVDVEAFRNAVRPAWETLTKDLGPEAQEIIQAIEAAG